MGWTIPAFTIVVLVSAIVAIAVGVLGLRRRPDPLAWPLAVMMFAVVAWAVPHAIALSSQSVEQVAFWHMVRYPGTVIAPVAFLVLTLRYAGYERWLSRRTYVALGVIPVLTLVIVWTNPMHGLFWRSLSVTHIAGASVFTPTYGPWYWINLGYLYLIVAAAMVILGKTAVQSGPLYRKQATTMFVGGFVPLVTNAAMNFGLGSDPMVDLTTTALAVSGLTFALALFYLDLLEISPVARDRLLDELDDGVVVIGPNNRIRDFNPTAARVLDDIAISQHADEVFPSHIASDGGELVIEDGNRTRRFRSRSSSLTDEHGRDVGRIVYLNDITELVEREQRISVLNRILRHNIRTEVSIVSGTLEIVNEQATGVDDDLLETATESTQRINELAEKARHVERTLQAIETSHVVSVAPAIEDVIAAIRDAYPDAIIEFDPPAEEISVRVADEKLFEVAVEELVTNAIIHNDQSSPTVTVHVDVDDDRVHVRIADDGPGIPADEQDILSSRVETQLDHGTGVGLWLVKWTASLSSGTIRFSENDPRGSIVTISLPLAERMPSRGESAK